MAEDTAMGDTADGTMVLSGTLAIRSRPNPSAAILGTSVDNGIYAASRTAHDWTAPSMKEFVQKAIYYLQPKKHIEDEEVDDRPEIDDAMTSELNAGIRTLTNKLSAGEADLAARLKKAYPILVRNKFRCDPDMDLEAPFGYDDAVRDASFFAFVLGTDNKMSPLLYYHHNKHRLLMVAPKAARSECEQVDNEFLSALRDRVDAYHHGRVHPLEPQYNKHQYFDQWWISSTKIPILNDDQRRQLDTLWIVTHAKWEELKRSGFEIDIPLELGIRCLLNLTHRGKSVGSDSVLARPCYEMRIMDSARRGMADVEEEAFSKTIRELATDEGIRNLSRGLSESDLLQAVLDLEFAG